MARRARTRALRITLCAMVLGGSACAEKVLDVAGSSGEGGACELAAGAESRCTEGLVCEPLAVDSGAGVCATPLEIHGEVIDLQTGAPIAGALVHGLDRTGAPLGEVAVSDAEGRYELRVSAPREADGAPADGLVYTLQASARDYLPFPAGIRVALPIAGSLAAYDEATQRSVIEGPLTTIGLAKLPADQRGGATIRGKVEGVSPGGTLVVAEAGAAERTAPYGLADRTGAYTLFNVPAGAIVVRGYRRGLELSAPAIEIGGGSLADVEIGGIDLAVVAEGDAKLGSVSGSVSLVNAPGSAGTSVVLVPVSVYEPALERGPIPYGLRAPDPDTAPNVGGAFTIAGVPAGTYKVLAAFEDDGLVRDPDTSIGGTNLQEVVVGAGEAVMVEAGFKVTGALAVVSPGADGPSTVSATPTFEFADDASEKSFTVRVFDTFGELVWEDPAVPGAQGGATVKVVYGGPALTPGLYYQFRAISVDGAAVPLSATEDLQGVFLVE